MENLGFWSDQNYVLFFCKLSSHSHSPQCQWAKKSIINTLSSVKL